MCDFLLCVGGGKGRKLDREVSVKTRVWLPANRLEVWPLLTDSRMMLSGCFCLGVPRPVACELVGEVGGVEAERRCISDRGEVLQRITGWEPGELLEFRMLKTNHAWKNCVETLEERFELVAESGGTRLTRVTKLRAKGRCAKLKACLIATGLKRVHHYVFKNWKNQLRQEKEVA